MADFCLECSKELFGEEVKSDFDGILSEDQSQEGFVQPVLCEGCGYICVDHVGKKIESEDDTINE